MFLWITDESADMPQSRTIYNLKDCALHTCAMIMSHCTSWHSLETDDLASLSTTNVGSFSC